ncbi:MAG TPA: hypothetical protein VLG13_01880 [Patescibacteria group bacterium]|nr:hypothetical protein [Patescibacteria group bacterium]
MANYLLLYHGGGMPETDEQKAAVMAAWDAWAKQAGDNLVDMGNPTSNSTAVTKDGAAGAVTGNPVTGYSVVKADSMDDAVKAAQMVPIVADGTGSCDVYETFDVAGM